MNEQDFTAKLTDLMQQLDGLPSPAREQLQALAHDTRDRHSRMKKTVNELQEALDYLRLSVKYLVFDLEATRRENQYLRKMLENKHGGNDARAKTSRAEHGPTALCSHTHPRGPHTPARSASDTHGPFPGRRRSTDRRLSVFARRRSGRTHHQEPLRVRPQSRRRKRQRVAHRARRQDPKPHEIEFPERDAQQQEHRSGRGRHAGAPRQLRTRAAPCRRPRAQTVHRVLHPLQPRRCQAPRPARTPPRRLRPATAA